MCFPQDWDVQWHARRDDDQIHPLDTSAIVSAEYEINLPVLQRIDIGLKLIGGSRIGNAHSRTEVVQQFGNGNAATMESEDCDPFSGKSRSIHGEWVKSDLPLFQLSQLERTQCHQHQNQSNNPEADHDLRFLPTELLEMVMQWCHLEHPLFPRLI